MLELIVLYISALSIWLALVKMPIFCRNSLKGYCERCTTPDRDTGEKFDVVITIFAGDLLDR